MSFQNRKSTDIAAKTTADWLLNSIKSIYTMNGKSVEQTRFCFLFLSTPPRYQNPNVNNCTRFLFVLFFIRFKWLTTQTDSNRHFYETPLKKSAPDVLSVKSSLFDRKKTGAHCKASETRTNKNETHFHPVEDMLVAQEKKYNMPSANQPYHLYWHHMDRNGNR